MALAQEKYYTFGDILNGDESERVELIDGQVYLMAPPTRAHQEILTALFLQLGEFLADKPCKVYPAPFGVRLFEEKNDIPENSDTMVEPDISVICDHDKLDDLGCKGAPDLVIEILSPSTQRHDRVTKFNLYERAGVREYWIVDPERQTVQVHTLEENRYYAGESYGSAAQISVGVLPGCVIDLGPVFPRA